jgi:hypothetical protein
VDGWRDSRDGEIESMRFDGYIDGEIESMRFDGYIDPSIDRWKDGGTRLLE